LDEEELKKVEKEESSLDKMLKVKEELKKVEANASLEKQGDRIAGNITNYSNFRGRCYFCGKKVYKIHDCYWKNKTYSGKRRNQSNRFGKSQPWKGNKIRTRYADSLSSSSWRSTASNSDNSNLSTGNSEYQSF